MSNVLSVSKGTTIRGGGTTISNQRWRDHNQRWRDHHQRWRDHHQRWRDHHQRWRDHNQRWRDCVLSPVLPGLPACHQPTCLMQPCMHATWPATSPREWVPWASCVLLAGPGRAGGNSNYCCACTRRRRSNDATMQQLTDCWRVEIRRAPAVML